MRRAEGLLCELASVAVTRRAAEAVRVFECQMAPAPQAAAASQAALRVLCLHGYVQNGSLFRQRTGSLRKALASRVKDWVFLDAPHSAAGAFPEGGSHEEDRAGPREAGEPQQQQQQPPGGDDVRGWWTSGENTEAAAAGQWVRPSQSRRAVGVDASLALLVETLEKEGPFDGILGFSQGAAMGALLLAHVQQTLALQQDGSVSGLALPRFAILVAGFVPMDDRLQSLMASSSLAGSVAVMCVSGTEDALVPPARVATLADCFGGPSSSRVQVFSHPGGHGIPSNAAFRTAVKAFLDSTLKKRSSDEHGK